MVKEILISEGNEDTQEAKVYNTIEFTGNKIKRANTREPTPETKISLKDKIAGLDCSAECLVTTILVTIVALAIVLGIWLTQQFAIVMCRDMNVRLEEELNKIVEQEHDTEVENYSSEIIKDTSGNIVGIVLSEEENKREKLGD